MKDSLRLCLSLYACEPHRGSEPGVGWAWALGMAKRHETWVLTRANNREVIEAELDRLGVPVEDRPHFVWVDLPRWIQRLKKRGFVPITLYYLLWQFAVRRAWDRTDIQVDIIHHVTFCSYVIPGVWWRRREKVVIGPMGGAAICPSKLLRVFRPRERIGEWFHGLFRMHRWLAPLYMLGRRNADAIFFTEEEVRSRLGGSAAMEQVLLDVAVPPELEAPSIECIPRKRQFLWAGLLIGRKGCEIAIRAYARAFGNDGEAPALIICGDGPYRQRLRHLALSLAVEDRIHFVGKLPQDALWREMRASLALVFTSVRDTCGTVAIEALAVGTPLIFFNHQGVKELADDSCGIPIEPRSFDKAVDDFAAAMRRLDDDPDLVQRLGSFGRKRIFANFTWKRQFDEADRCYKTIIVSSATAKSSRLPTPPTSKSRS